MFEKIKSLFRGEPVIVVLGLIALVSAAAQEALGSLDANAGWRTVALAIGAAIVRHFVSPAQPEPETPEQQRFWSGEPRV